MKLPIIHLCPRECRDPHDSQLPRYVVDFAAKDASLTCFGCNTIMRRLDLNKQLPARVVMGVAP